jgi:two-component system, chemotaxis family, chemotaxis protein CheY
VARILLIDDDDALRTMIRVALEAHGHAVTEAGDGREALRLHRLAPAELVLTDIQMPGRGGLEVLMDLRRESPDVKVIAMSGGGSMVSSAAALEMAVPLGATASLAKPFKLEALFEAVDRALAA